MKRLFTTAIYILCVILTTSGNTNEKTLTMMFKQLSISEGLSTIVSEASSGTVEAFCG